MYCAFELSIRLRYVYLKWNLLPCKGEINSPGVCMKKDIEMPAKMTAVWICSHMCLHCFKGTFGNLPLTTNHKLFHSAVRFEIKSVNYSCIKVQSGPSSVSYLNPIIRIFLLLGILHIYLFFSFVSALLKNVCRGIMALSYFVGLLQEDLRILPLLCRWEATRGFEISACAYRSYKRMVHTYIVVQLKGIVFTKSGKLGSFADPVIGLANKGLSIWKVLRFKKQWVK